MRDLINIVTESLYPLADRDPPPLGRRPGDGWYGNGDYEARGGKIVWMDPEEYLGKVRPLKIDDISRENIDDLKQHIRNGNPLDPLVIYPDGKEDGRHRAHAAKELGIDKVPVIVFPKTADQN